MLALTTVVPDQWRKPDRVSPRQSSRLPWAWGGLKFFVPLVGSPPDYEHGPRGYGRPVYAGGSSLDWSDVGVSVALDGGTGTYIELLAGGWVLAGSDQLTIMTVFRRTELVRDVALYCERAAGFDVLKLGSTGGQLLTTYRDDSTTLDQNSGGALVAGRWHVGMMVRDSASIFGYLDGKLVCTTVRAAGSTFTDASPKCSVGSDRSDTAVTLDGDIALAAGWTRAFTAQEVMAISRDPFGWYSPRRSAVILSAAPARWGGLPQGTRSVAVTQAANW